MSAPIESYGMIGDCKTAALVGLDGSIDWLCWPRFDSDACFAKLLGGQSNGFWLITPPTRSSRRRRCYRADTLILETTFETESGKATLIDFMLPHGALVRPDPHRALRRGRGRDVHGADAALRLRRDDALGNAAEGRHDARGRRSRHGGDAHARPTSAARTSRRSAQFTLTKGKTMPFVLSYQPSHLPLPEPIDPDDALKKCEKYLEGVDGEHQDRGPAFRGDQALAADPEGAHLPAERRHRRRADDLAARAVRQRAQLGLPAVLAARRHPHPARHDERRHLRRGGGMARLAAPRRRGLSRRDADHVRAPRRAAADRMGGGLAAGLRRFDAGAGRQRRAPAVPARRLWRGDGRLRPVAQGRAGLDRGRLGAAARAGRPRLPGLERAGQRHLGDTRAASSTSSIPRSMAWVCFDRAVKAVEQSWPRRARSTNGARCAMRSMPRSATRASTASATASAPPTTATCSMPACCCWRQTGFVKPDDPRFVGTVEAIEKDLLLDGFVKRYSTHEMDDGLKPGEGAFLACSFWLADAYISIGRHGRAEAVQAPARHPQRPRPARRGIRSARKRQQGNFPQAFSHIALINTAFNLTRARSRRSSAPTAKVAEGGSQADAKNVSAPARAQPSSSFFKVSLTAFGLALPPVAFITWPTNQPNSVGLAL